MYAVGLHRFMKIVKISEKKEHTVEEAEKEKFREKNELSTPMHIHTSKYRERRDEHSLQKKKSRMMKPF